MRPGLVALDVDGTLVDLDGAMSERVREAVRRVAANGTNVVVATGRSLLGTLPVLDRLSLTTGWAVCSNGAVTVRLDPDLPDGYEVEDVVTFDPTPALQLLHEHLPGALYAVEDIGLGFRVTGAFPEGELPGDLTIVPFAELVDGPATRVVVRSPEHEPEDFLRLTAEIGLQGVGYAVGWTAWLDLAPEGVSKASALELVRQRLDVDLDRTLAVGDGRNDLEMLAWAARGVAMGNAPEEVRDAADEVAPPIERDGLAHVLEPLL